MTSEVAVQQPTRLEPRHSNRGCLGRHPAWGLERTVVCDARLLRTTRGAPRASAVHSRCPQRLMMKAAS